MVKQPVVYVIAGPNGSGKTTFATKFLPAVAKCDEFVNADSIAMGLSPLSPQSVRIDAGRILLKRIKALASAGKTFGFETTLSGRTYLRMFRAMRERGYQIHIFFLWVRSVELALKRIADRVKLRGHDVPEPDVRRRYVTGVRNLFAAYRPLADAIVIMDNSTEKPALVAVAGVDGFVVHDKKILAEMLEAGNIAKDEFER